MPIIPSLTDPQEGFSAVRLARYAQIIGVDECRFWGVNGPNIGNSCRTIWTLQQRIMVAKYLAEAQLEIERVVGYPVGKRWIVEPKRTYTCPALTLQAWVIQGGIMASADISLGEAVDNTSDPAMIGPVATTVTDSDEIHIYHPGSSIEIDPSNMVINAGFVTIEIPRCRLVTVALADNPDAGLTYSNLANFETTVDIKRVYNDPSTQAILSTNHQCSAICASGGCSAYTQAACEFVTDPEVGGIEAHPGTYSNGTWRVKLANCCNLYQWMQLNYEAGKPLDFQMEDAIVRLAHSKMPTEPCGCDPARNVWKRDRNTPEVLTRERLNCRFGLSDGAWMAWQFALDMAVMRSGVAA